MTPSPIDHSPAGIVRRLCRHSRYARHALDADPALGAALMASVERPLGADEMAHVLEAIAEDDEAGLRVALRRLRRRVFLHVAARDLAGLAPLDEVVSCISALADLAVRRAQSTLEAVLEAQYGPPIGEGSGRRERLMVIGMGKLGGLELNVSSDIDLIFVYPEEGETAGPRRISNQEYFGQIGRRLIALLQEPTGDGYVFRVDMRLRPYGDGGPLVVNLAMLEAYLATQGRPWERYAWLKARCLTGERHQDLTDLVRPFVYRRYLDFSALSSLRELHGQIRAEVRQKERFDDIKLGPGGIREVEFVAQLFQLIRGGREPSLQLRGTRAALARLGELRLLPDGVAAELLEAYALLRAVEHRLQYADDAQTQRLPGSAGDHALLAESMGCVDSEAFTRLLERHRATVSRHFDAVFAAAQGPGGSHPLHALWQGQERPDEAAARLRSLGYDDPDPVLRRLSDMRAGVRYRQLGESARARLDALMPAVVEAAAQGPVPARTLDRVLELIQAVARRESYLALLLEYPRSLHKLAQLAAESRWAVHYLTQNPLLLDELLDQRQLDAPLDWPELTRTLDAHLSHADGDRERELDALRHFKQAVVFRLIAQDLSGLLALETLSDHLSALADLLLDRTLALAWRAQRDPHRARPAFAVIGFGKLGGKELGYGSDLDIIFIYQDDHRDAGEIYARYAQRVNQWLNAFTGAGILYQTDLRLRPDGASGLLVTTLEAFAEYQRSHAWVWEQQALTRARWCAGDAAIGAGFEAIRESVLRQPRDRAALRAEVTGMRARMLTEHPPKPGVFDVKGDPGGIIDVEFIVQYLVLAHASTRPELTRNAGNIALLGAAAACGLIPADLAQRVADRYREMRRLQHLAWLHEDDRARLGADAAAEFASPVRELWRLTLG